MNRRKELSEVWIKASIAGTIWAASEIVLGSFLHNLKVPFSGNILTSIGIILLISLSFVWKEKGLFWRSGLVCAIMKTLSPSAVIFGPMIAILSEAILLEISIRLLGRTMIGYILGAMLAMSWNLFQKVVNMIIFYGSNIVDLYKSLINLAEKQLHIETDTAWLPLLFLLCIYCLLGIISAIIGIRVGRKILSQPAEPSSQASVKPAEKFMSKQSEFNYSLLWLFADLLLIISSLVMLGNLPATYWSVAITLIITLWAIRYKRALRQLSKPRFWFFFVGITMLTALVFAKVQSDTITIQKGLLIGLQMNFRAAIIIVGFSVLGTELYNPKIRDFFLKTTFRQLPLSLELAFESLPSMIANIPEFKKIVKNPVSVIYQVVSQAEIRLAEVKKRFAFSQKVFIIKGSVGVGKTEIIQKIINELKKNNFSVGGIYSPRIIQNGITVGYDIADVSGSMREIFLRLNDENNPDKIGKFKIFPVGLKAGTQALEAAVKNDNSFIIIDEAGQLELEDKGWASGIYETLRLRKSHLILAVRDSLVEKVIQKFKFGECYVLDLSENNVSTLYDFFAKIILSQGYHKSQENRPFC